MTTTDGDPRLKRMRFRAWHRGFREMDLLFGAFADDSLDTMDEAGLSAFETLLTVPDWDLYAWITGSKEVPANWDTPVTRALIAHARARPRP